MPSFEIPDGPTTVKLSGSLTDAAAPRTGSVVFSVNNKAGETRAGRLSVQVAGQTKAEWFAIEGEQERKFDPANSETVTVKMNVPGAVAAGNYPFRLRVVAVNDPDNDFSDGPATTVEVAAPVVVTGGSNLWIWIVLAVVLLALIGGLLWFFLKGDKEPTTEPTTAPTVAATQESKTAKVPELIGKTLGEARQLAGDFDLIDVAGPAEGKKPDTITGQNPDGGTSLTKHSPLKVTFDPGVTVPSIKGTNALSAINELGRAGLNVTRTSSECVTRGVSGTVINVSPDVGARVAKGTGIVLTVAEMSSVINGVPQPCRPRIKIDLRDIERMSRVSPQ